MSGEATIPVALLNCNERGGNLFTRGRGRVHFIRNLGQDRWLNICYTEDNYPSFEVEMLKMSVVDLAKGLTKTYKGDQLEICKMNDFCPRLDENLQLLRFEPLVQLDQMRETPKKRKT